MRGRRTLTLMGIFVFSALTVVAQDGLPPSGAETGAESRPTLQRGAWYVSGYSGGSGFAAWINAGSDDAEADLSLQGFNLRVSGGYFVADRIAVGPELSAGFTRLVDPADNLRTEFEVALGLQGAYFLELGNSRWVPVSRLAIAYERKTVRDDAKVDDEVENGVSISPKLGVTYFFTNRLTGGAEAVYSFTRRTADDGDTIILSHAVGLGIGITVFFR